MGLGSGIRDPGSEIRDPEKPIPDPGSRGQKGTGSRIPDPGVKKAPDPGSRGQKGTGSRIRIRNTDG